MSVFKKLCCYFTMTALIMLYMVMPRSVFSQNIDAKLVDDLKRVKDRILGLNSYRYTLTNITVKKKRTCKNVIKYNFKKPDEIRLEWLSPNKLRGQLAVYSNNVMRVVPAWLPFAIEINPDSDLGKGDANYPIYCSCMGMLLRQVIDDLNRAVSAKVIEDTQDFVIYELKNDTNMAKVKIDKRRNIPLYIEQYDLKGNIVDFGYFDDFEENVQYPDDFFKL